MLNIKQRQMNLKFLNYAVGEIDGIEGKRTKQAYRAFQRDFNLNVDGIYGEKTNAKLVEVIKEIQTKIGTDVDGVAGEKTKQKTKEYQERNKLRVDGICGVATRASLNNTGLSWDNIKYFKKVDFNCPCCGLNNIEIKIVQMCDNIREHFGVPIIISSGTRCTKHNAKVGGVQGSRHKLGKAADICVQGKTTSEVLKYTKSLVAQGKLRYTYTNNSNMNGAVHIDIQ